MPFSDAMFYFAHRDSDKTGQRQICHIISLRGLFIKDVNGKYREHFLTL